MNNKTIKATLAAFLAQVIFGFSFMFTKIALDYASPLTVIADRYIIAFIVMTFVIMFTKTKLTFRKNIWKLLLMALFQPVFYFIFESYGIAMTTSAFSSVMISLIPVLAMICGIFVLKEVPTPLQYIFAIISVLGVVIMTLSGQADGTVTLLGIILLFGAVVSSVAYNITSRKISAEFSSLERTYAMMAIGAIVFTSISLIENIHNPISVVSSFSNIKYTISVSYLGIISSVVAFLLLNYANTYLAVTKTTVFSNLTTVVSVFAGIVFLKEKFSVISAVSTLMIVIGVCGVQVFGSKNADSLNN